MSDMLVKPSKLLAEFDDVELWCPPKTISPASGVPTEPSVIVPEVQVPDCAVPFGVVVSMPVARTTDHAISSNKPEPAVLLVLIASVTSEPVVLIARQQAIVLPREEPTLKTCEYTCDHDKLALLIVVLSVSDGEFPLSITVT
jgi:hypothetical protein